MFRLEDEGLGPDLHDGRRLHRCGDGEQSQLRTSCSPISSCVSLQMQVLQTSVKVQSLKRREVVTFVHVVTLKLGCTVAWRMCPPLLFECFSLIS